MSALFPSLPSNERRADGLDHRATGAISRQRFRPVDVEGRRHAVSIDVCGIIRKRQPSVLALQAGMLAE